MDGPYRFKRLLEIIPGFLSWFIILFLLVLFMVKPLSAAIVMIVYLLYWVCRLLYMSILLVMAHQRVLSKRNVDWLGKCRDVQSDIGLNDVLHVVLYTTYKEPNEVLEGSLNSLKEVDFPRQQIVVVLAGEAREAYSDLKLDAIKKQYKEYFKDVIVTIHPNKIEGEIPAKGANATYAARQVKEYLLNRGLKLENVIISCFDADTCSDKNYFSCLTYNFLSIPKRHKVSFQPFPVYSNNIYTAPAFARVIEIGSTFWQLIESMRYEKFITFSSHSMSFKTLDEVGYWPVDLISDDSLIFWKCFIKYDGDYRTLALDVPVYMDIAVGKSFWETVKVQYKQKRRWAWGVENFVFLGLEFSKNRNIPLYIKFSRLFQTLDNHINWATWTIVISLITPLVLLWGRLIMKNSLVMFNLSYINTITFNSLSFILILCVIISYEFLPPRPKGVSRLIYVSFVLQWALIPLISATLGSLPALDAQTRLMLGKYLYFNTTPKARKESNAI